MEPEGLAATGQSVTELMGTPMCLVLASRVAVPSLDGIQLGVAAGCCMSQARAGTWDGAGTEGCAGALPGSHQHPVPNPVSAFSLCESLVTGRGVSTVMSSSASKLCLHLFLLLCYSSTQAPCAPRPPLPPESRQRLCCAPFPSERQLCWGDAWGSLRGMSPPAADGVSSSHSQVSTCLSPTVPILNPVCLRLGPFRALVSLGVCRAGTGTFHCTFFCSAKTNPTWQEPEGAAGTPGWSSSCKAGLRPGGGTALVHPTGPTPWPCCPVSCPGHRSPGAWRGHRGRSFPVPCLCRVTGCGGPAGGSRGAQRDLC